MSEPAQSASANPWEPIFHYAVQFHGAGRLDEAGSLFVAILEHNPDHFPSLHRLASIRRNQGRLAESVALLERALAANPDSADAHNSLANTLSGLDRLEEAMSHYRSAIMLRENFPEAHFNLGRCLHRAGRFEEAEAAYRSAIALRPAYAEAHSNLGTVLARLNRPSEALACFSAALSADPATKMAYSNIGMALSALKRYEDAAPYFERARALDPDAPQPVFNDAILHLAMGDYERGFRDFEARWLVPELNLRPREFPQPRWDGEADLAGKTILVYAEQGLGDTILFARFLAPLASLGARVALDVQKPLARLMTSIPAIAQLVTTGDPLPDFDFHLPIGSLPLAFNTTFETLPSRTPYLFAPAPAVAISARETRVGVCWAGNPDYGNDHNRSIPLSIFEPLLRVPDVRFVSLQQKTRAGDEAILSAIDSIDLASVAKEKDLADTAATISQLDVVITVDTVIAHLAGALNRTVWILLPFYAHWVWMRETNESKWYPSARLFRQPRIGDWAGVIERVAAELAETHVNR